MLENYADRLPRRVRKDLAEAEEALGEGEVRAERGGDGQAVPERVRQNVEELMNACDMAYGSLGKVVPGISATAATARSRALAFLQQP